MTHRRSRHRTVHKPPNCSCSSTLLSTVFLTQQNTLALGSLSDVDFRQMSISDLAVELVDHILDQCNTASCVALMKCNRRLLRIVANRRLRYIRISFKHPVCEGCGVLKFKPEAHKTAKYNLKTPDGVALAIFSVNNYGDLSGNYRFAQTLAEVAPVLDLEECFTPYTSARFQSFLTRIRFDPDQSTVRFCFWFGYGDQEQLNLSWPRVSTYVLFVHIHVLGARTILWPPPLFTRKCVVSGVAYYPQELWVLTWNPNDYRHTFNGPGRSWVLIMEQSHWPLFYTYAHASAFLGWYLCHARNDTLTLVYSGLPVEMRDNAEIAWLREWFVRVWEKHWERDNKRCSKVKQAFVEQAVFPRDWRRALISRISFLTVEEYKARDGLSEAEWKLESEF